MDQNTEILENLVKMSRDLGMPDKDYVILGDGNSSARMDGETYYVKASGAHMENIRPEQFVSLRTAHVLKMLDRESMSDEEIAACLEDSKLNPLDPHPSIESVLHALAIELCGANYVGHTHPTAWVGILSSRNAEDAISGRIFTEQVNICGPAALFIPYLDPGLPLAQAVKERMKTFIAQYGEPPREILLQNHGLIALGHSPQEVLNITAMSVRAARVLSTTYALGGPQFLSQEEVERIRSRMDEKFRRNISNTSGD